MLNRLLAALLAICLAGPAFAQTVSCPGPTGGNCIPVLVMSSAAGAAGYPASATPVIANSNGTTGGTVATLPAAAGKFTYICGFTTSPGSATAAITINLTISGVGATLNEWVGAPVTAAGTTGLTVTRSFNPCIPSSAVNTAIAVGASALGAGGINQAIYAWGYQQ